MTMRCLLCKNGAMKPDTDSYFAKIGQGYVIIENVPCYKCDQCGETIFSSSVMERIDEIIESIEKTMSKISIVEYSAAA